MDFYKLTDFQLYSIINSRHLDADQKATATRELDRRNLSPEELQHLKDELIQKEKSFSKISPNVLLMILIFVALMILRQSGCSH